ncbi:methylmalonyl-CoA mutase family protein [Novipirellula artificiosorum]|uniref:Methylmalonyl-CoA mutase small subunit n=1 Tax=Novipirellula artificiosorum TaxID=2528016 RepID=A0A5C6DZK7_9BACT|nr:methylmalonyl-CoA mutase family protein [Novipirellula artificiosorum]TWU42873.1 Methylmalonyl-CoA mutase small subunit [Novipirellula artificiosorum]
MSSSKLSVKDDFPPVDYETWRSTVEATLHGAPFEKKLVSHTYEGIDIQPVYTRRDELEGKDPSGFPGSSPFLRGSKPLGSVLNGTDLRQEHAHPDIDVTNKAILADLEGGVTSILIKLDTAARQGNPPSEVGASVGHDGVMAYDVHDFDGVLKKVGLDIIDVALDAGAAYLPAAATLAGVWDNRGVIPAKARGAFNADPLAALAREGKLPLSAATAMKQLADLAKWTSQHYPHVTAVGVDTAPYHDAGATAAQDIAFSMATAVEYLRAMTDVGMSIDDAAKQFLFRISLGTHHFLAIAKVRAARQLWARVIEASGGKPAGMKIHTRTGNRVLTQRDPYVNLLRNTVAAFSGIVGGADAVTSVPFDQAAQLPNDFSRRIARNTVLILDEESHLNCVVDPAGGSWFIEKLSSQLAESAWGLFQQIEAEGGMFAALKSGWIASQIDAAYAPRAKDIATRREGITGVSEFPNLAEEQLDQRPVDVGALRKAAADRQNAKSAEMKDLSLETVLPAACLKAASEGASISQLARAIGFHKSTTEMTAIEPHLFAQPFEELRDASDVWCTTKGQRPCVFLANMGPVAHHTARATFAKNFFEAGGFEVIGNEGFNDADAVSAALKASGANIAVICSSDKLYPEMVPAVAPALKAAGARSIVLAGHPADNESAWREAGVDRFIFIKCDVLATLRELLTDEGVLS